MHPTEVVARIDGREFETVLLDIGLDKTSGLAPVELSLPAMLSFADLPTVKIPALPIEWHLAEKVHAYTRRYGPDADTPSSRVKDLIDIALITASLSVEGEQLRLALDSVFETRDRQSLPVRLPVPLATGKDPGGTSPLARSQGRTQARGTRSLRG